MIRSKRFITLMGGLAVAAPDSPRPSRRAGAGSAACEGTGQAEGQRPRGTEARICRRMPSHPFDVVLGRPTDRAVTASVLAYQRMEGYITYGMEKEHHTVKTEVMTLAPENPVEFVLKDLKADARYFYRIHTRALDRAGIPIG